LNCKLEISIAPTKAKLWKPAYSQVLIQKKIDRQGSWSEDPGRQTVRRLWWALDSIWSWDREKRTNQDRICLKSSVFSLEWKSCGEIAKGEVFVSFVIVMLQTSNQTISYRSKV